MMTREIRIIPLSEMPAFVGALMQGHKVLAPTRNDDGLCVFAWLAAPEQADWTCGIPQVPPKQAFLPRTEILFTYHREKGRETITPPPAPEPQIALGLHPCDVQAVKVLDAVFSAEPSPDQPYLARRAATTLIGRGFTEQDPLVFCRELGIDPMDNRDCDAFLVPLAGGQAEHTTSRMALEILTDKGVALRLAYDGFPKAGVEDLAAIAEARKQSAARGVPLLDMAVIQRRLENIFNSDLWNRIHEPCVGCGACAFLCPTCHCFDIQEEVMGQDGARVRVWDTCQFDLFTRHASGHNPRLSQKERSRQRIMHKFSYGVGKFHIPFCVGCGRCIAVCPAHNDVRQILKEISDFK
ncbi:MAG: 4Fe-4S dicluster domain-containing protein [Verrucomicrobia bacterium]|nr:4Fe-4S dicluster domain-containing protein [Verrucomicrobiota bacterium]MCG2680542.1 4Fe-4S dicluster domain-containing protein [Kiritimatiellia bacterium]MBU4246898.1 4Fe-4S dicluster domain-containing protein [Verrucomicrobiota bacterium]MBU4290823.1 4Fe-4S dicluster domain-containing protein [Verrucomicrobiota bacterium]MBU4428837.1 4Fe-4S dicluster domain-containing protein [Verrucomicrobiota bacterium]